MRAIRPLLLLLGCVGSSWAAPPVPAGGLFGPAALAPRDATLYVQIIGGAAIRADVQDQSLGRWILSQIERGQLHLAWQRLARAAGMSAEDLFDRALGHDFTLMSRLGTDGGSGAETSSWALVAVLNEAGVGQQLVDRVPNTVRGPVNGLSIRELPQHDLVLALGGRWLMAGPLGRPQMFNEVVGAVGNGAEPTLGSTLAMIQARKIVPEGTSRGQVGVYVQHDPSVGGWSVISAALIGDHVAIRHHSQYRDRSTVLPVSLRELDLSPLQSVRPQAVIAVVESEGGTEGAIATLLHGRLPTIARGFKEQLSSRRLLVLAERPANGCEARVASPAPTLVCGVEVRGAPGMAGRRPFELQRLPSLLASNALPAGDDLAWQCMTDATASNWCFVSDDPQSRMDIQEALEQPPDGVPPTRGRWILGGVLHGPRLASHLRAWLDPAADLGGESVSAEVLSAARSVAELMDAIDRASWTVARPAMDQLHIEATVSLAPRRLPAPAVRAR